ncbi:hypothetical protein BC828DRAFT_379806 [Blastocladiella britannica]|nr:hypothetical protein BC828DRAFT_379806 [Blastocladiella britannica]
MARSSRLFLTVLRCLLAGSRSRSCWTAFSRLLSTRRRTYATIGGNGAHSRRHGCMAQVSPATRIRARRMQPRPHVSAHCRGRGCASYFRRKGGYGNNVDRGAPVSGGAGDRAAAGRVFAGHARVDVAAAAGPCSSAGVSI